MLGIVSIPAGDLQNVVLSCTSISYDDPDGAWSFTAEYPAIFVERGREGAMARGGTGSKGWMAPPFDLQPSSKCTTRLPFGQFDHCFTT